MDSHILELLQSFADGRREFLNHRNVRLIDFRDRGSILTRYFQTEMAITDLLTRLYAQQQTNDIANSIVRLTIPSRFLDPVRVTATTDQINNSLITRDVQDSPCAICQEAISSGGVVLRHCSHGYHRSCILQWFSSSVRCPTCRHDIRETGLASQTSSASA